MRYQQRLKERQFVYRNSIEASSTIIPCNLFDSSTGHRGFWDTSILRRQSRARGNAPSLRSMRVLRWEATTLKSRFLIFWGRAIPTLGSTSHLCIRLLVYINYLRRTLFNLQKALREISLPSLQSLLSGCSTNIKLLSLCSHLLLLWSEISVLKRRQAGHTSFAGNTIVVIFKYLKTKDWVGILQLVCTKHTSH